MNDKIKLRLIFLIYFLVGTILLIILKHIYIGNDITNIQIVIFTIEASFIILEHLLSKITPKNNNFVLKVYIGERYIILVLILLFYFYNIHIAIIDIICTILIVKSSKNWVYKRKETFFQNKEIEFKIISMSLQEIIFLFSC